MAKTTNDRGWRQRKKLRSRQRRQGAPRPLLSEGEVYITKKGNKWHTAWCSTINGIWLAGSNAILVVPLADVERTHGPCSNCEL